MSSIKSVAVAGASGVFGVPVVHQLLDDGFKVTILTRKGATHNFPSSVTVAEVDYNSPETLVKALEGQDAVVSTVGFAGLTYQIPLIEAAIKAGVKRFLPSEFSLTPSSEKGTQLPPFQPKRAASEALKKAAGGGKITYSLIATGPFLDLALGSGLLIDLKKKDITLWNGGDVRFSATTIASSVKAVSQVLKHPEETKNREIFVNSVAVTQNELLEKGKKAVGADGWTTRIGSTDELHKKALEAFRRGEDPRFEFITVSIWGDGYGNYVKGTDNELLGIHELTDAELQDFFNKIAK
ncbi:NAD(P)-binding protein [Hypoxylon trugodes]|uniref:NAD(P)-binding protein n=1 Tax=Hypoxylon trugodes TaxID=326681 RepID=UPI002199A43C|nr:NAD(P)-binding protein [Hypoxylon trugodes]KAI1390794.1 NAD(P)-binding protein [Hypoxylon trugodes]